MPLNNLEMIQQVAHGLGGLKNDVVFVGGSVAELYAENPELSDIRPTLDVDCVVEISSYKGYGELEIELRRLGFRNDRTPNAPLCRWIYQDIIVDVMPDDPDIIGFSNRWYHAGIANKIERVLPDNTRIFIFSVEYYAATKFEAMNSRGGNNLRTSHDFEDIIYIFDNCTDFSISVQNNISGELREYLAQQCSRLLQNDTISEAIECALPLESDNERTNFIYEIIEGLASIT